MSFTNSLLFHLSKKVSTAFVLSVFFEKMTKTTFTINRQLRRHLKQERNEIYESGAGFRLSAKAFSSVER